MRLFGAFSVAFVTILILGCPVNSRTQNIQKSAIPIPQNSTIEYQWIAGSMPPPYHYEYMIRISSSGEGTIVYCPDYPSAGIPEWKERFTISSEQLEQLNQVMEHNGLFTERWQAQTRHIVGGSYEYLSVAGNGKKIEIPPFVIPEQNESANNIYSAIRAITPEVILDKLEAQRQEYMKAYKER